MSARITVLISGSGSNLQALIDSQRRGELKGQITQVISSNENAFGLVRAKEAGIPTKIHSLKSYYEGTSKDQKEERRKRRELFNKDLGHLIVHGQASGVDLAYAKPDLIVCAGWMLILSPAALQPLEAAGITIINLHPALPGAFDGTHAIERAWKAGQSGEIAVAGVMIHRVITEVDRGEPVLVKEIQLQKDETLEQYEARVHDLEHVAIVEGTNIVLGQIA